MHFSIKVVAITTTFEINLTVKMSMSTALVDDNSTYQILALSTFSFSDLSKKPVERNFSDDAPSWRVTNNGLNLEGNRNQK